LREKILINNFALGVFPARKYVKFLQSHIAGWKNHIPDRGYRLAVATHYKKQYAIKE